MKSSVDRLFDGSRPPLLQAAIIVFHARGHLIRRGANGRGFDHRAARKLDAISKSLFRTHHAILSAGAGEPAAVPPNQRTLAFRNALTAYWTKANPNSITMPWSQADRAALRRFLARHPVMTEPHFQLLLSLRLRDAKARHTEPASLWLRHLGRNGGAA